MIRWVLLSLFGVWNVDAMRWLLLIRAGGQLDFEDEQPEDDEGESGESERSEDQDSESEEDQFEDAMEKLVISDTPAVSVSTWLYYGPCELYVKFCVLVDLQW